jgi:hypothetical protein
MTYVAFALGEASSLAGWRYLAAAPLICRTPKASPPTASRGGIAHRSNSALCQPIPAKLCTHQGVSIIVGRETSMNDEVVRGSYFGLKNSGGGEAKRL